MACVGEKIEKSRKYYGMAYVREKYLEKIMAYVREKNDLKMLWLFKRKKSRKHYVMA